MKKIVASLLTIITCLTLFCSTAFAADETIMPMRYMPCDICNNGRVLESGTEYSSWHDTGEVRTCTHNHAPYYNDKQQVRTATVLYTCTNCGATAPVVRTEYRWVCLFPG